MRKGIILAGGAGTRLHPLTQIISKQLLPIYNKPLIYYPLTTLMLAGIRDILIITTPHDQNGFVSLLGDGQQWGLNITYSVQPKPDGLAQAFVIGEEFLNGGPAALVLGDNIFYGQGLSQILQSVSKNSQSAAVFGCHVEDPSRYGVAEFNESGKIINIIEKPHNPPSSMAITGLYFYDETVCEKAKSLTPSKRGELEITDLNNVYLEAGNLDFIPLGRGYAWFDTGTFDSLLSASQFIKTIEERQNLMIGCVEEVAYRLGFIDEPKLQKLIKGLGKSPFAKYLASIIHEPAMDYQVNRL
jgi:glucose-1-phosphate thymidylyltransferase